MKRFLDRELLIVFLSFQDLKYRYLDAKLFLDCQSCHSEISSFFNLASHLCIYSLWCSKSVVINLLLILLNSIINHLYVMLQNDVHLQLTLFCILPFLLRSLKTSLGVWHSHIHSTQLYSELWEYHHYIVCCQFHYSAVWILKLVVILIWYMIPDWSYNLPKSLLIILSVYYAFMHVDMI